MNVRRKLTSEVIFLQMIARLNHIDSYDFSRQGHFLVHTCIPLEAFCKVWDDPFYSQTQRDGALSRPRCRIELNSISIDPFFKSCEFYIWTKCRQEIIRQQCNCSLVIYKLYLIEDPDFGKRKEDRTCSFRVTGWRLIQLGILDKIFNPWKGST